VEFAIDFTADAEKHLRGLTANQRAQILDAVAKQLVHDPNVITRNRKAMRANKLAAWELRVGMLRVYYDVVVGPEPKVVILAIGIKSRNRVFIGNKEVQW
jgi:mRNA-degrading endonuclease RelE of RelBE toxin-antitoxin system